MTGGTVEDHRYRGRRAHPHRRLPCDVCLSGACAFATVQAAIAAAAAGATIRICPVGHIAKPLTLIGAGNGASGTILDGEANPDAPVMRLAGDGAVGLRNLVVRYVYDLDWSLGSGASAYTGDLEVVNVLLIEVGVPFPR